MTVRLPPNMPAETADRLEAGERQAAQALQRSGTGRHPWRIAGQDADISIFDVESVDELHQIVSTLPLFPSLTDDR